MYVALLRTILKPGELAWAAASACRTPSEYGGGAYSQLTNESTNHAINLIE